MKLVTVAEMQAVEREADAGGLSYAQMMENAGKGLADAVSSSYSHLRQKGVLGLVGSGNNGGDTLVALAHLAAQGWRAAACLVRPRPIDDPLVRRLGEAGGKVLSLSGESTDHRLEELLHSHAILLDGVLGTGARLPLKPEVAGALETVRCALPGLEDVHVIAVDCPSGVDCDSGAAAPECIPAELTVTMAAVKVGLLKFPAFTLVGRLELAGIGLDENGGLLAPDPPTWRKIRRQVIEQADARRALPPRPPDAHKGTFGAVMVAAGSASYTGAALLAGRAAYRSGAGLVTLAVPELLHPALAGQFLEATWVLLPHSNGFIAAEAAEILEQNLGRATALLLGPGFGLAETTREFLFRLLRADRTSNLLTRLPPVIVDADGLKLLAQLPDWDRLLPAPAVLTPHPGEMAILTGLTASEIQSDRLGHAERFARAWGHVVVLKGAFTVIASPDGRCGVIPVASPALARAGTGDVLAGLIAGLRAQGVDAFQAAAAGAWIHAQAGLQAAKHLGSTAAVLAGDVLEAVAPVLRSIAV